MSFNALKEALKPCKTNLSFSSPSLSSSQISQECDSTISRKPPKSTLSRQLLRLQEDTAFCSQIQENSFKTGANVIPGSENDGDNMGDKERKVENGPKDPELESFLHLDHSGPYEPLVLSPPGEIPVVQAKDQ